ncbi:unnamed protein product [Leptosia nina]|uniref:Uncharacterized protein n=1 Tax=Leptosia nina TaxID=320188 RepID=A0AAV1JJQ3_9NEOP
MDKLNFEFQLMGDGKSNVVHVISIMTTDGRIYILPQELQIASMHTELIKCPAYSKVKNSLKKRHQTRKVWITLSKEMKNVYMDEEGNLQFSDQYLEENQSQFEPKETQTLEKLLEKILINTQGNKPQNLSYTAERFVIDKFSSKHTNANQWIEFFEKECERFEVTSDSKKIEMLRLLMDKSCNDWYNSMFIKYTMDSEWLIWKTKFCETFASKGWNPVAYALKFKYQDGSLLDYALKKESLLLDMRRTIDKGTLIDLIVFGLPEYVMNKIDREELKDTVELFNEIHKYEHMVNKKSYIVRRKNNYYPKNNNYYNEGKQPCKTCEKSNKGIRYHSEAVCWFKSKEDEKTKRYNIKHVNNSVIEAKLNESEEKN